MTFFDMLNLFGGISLFLLGMKMMGDALEQRAGGQLKALLSRLTSSPVKGFLVGLLATAVIQSSGATTVMVVGFVNSGVMQLSQAINVIMGANVGTTVTAWLLSLTGIQGDGFFIQLLKPSSFSPVLGLIGIILYMFIKKEKSKQTGMALLGFSVLMYGMQTMSSSVEPLSRVQAFTDFLLLLSNPVLGVLAGAAMTAVIQSSSASVGILQALSVTGVLTNGSAAPIIMGQNIGACVTTLLASAGANKNARRAALVHLYFNIIGTVFWLLVYFVADSVFHPAFLSAASTPLSISIIHSSFNIGATALLLPFGRQLERLSKMSIRDQGTDERALLDERLFVTPTLALQQANDVSTEMEKTAFSALTSSLSLLNAYDEKSAAEIKKKEDETDNYEDALGSYLVKLSEHKPGEEDVRGLTELLRLIGDFERIADHAVNLMESAQEKHDKNLQFSDAALGELRVMSDAVLEIMHLSQTAFETNDLSLARRVEPLEQVIDDLQQEIRTRHLKRLTNAQCTIEMGFVLSDILTNLERVADHCSNIAACVCEIAANRLNMHAFTHDLKESPADFEKMYGEYKKKYALND